MLGFYLFLIIPLVNGRYIDQNLGIYNGSYAVYDEFPFMVSLRLNNLEHFCGGTLVSSKWVLTAAHCIVNYCPNEVEILFGTVFSFHNQEAPSRHTRRAKRFIVHDIYKDMGFQRYDAGLIELEQEVPPLFRIYANLSNSIPETIKSVVVGWGKSNNNTMADTLKKAHLQILNNTECESRIITFESDIQFCGVPIDGIDCEGDSGGPILQNGTQYGIVSYGSFSCQKSSSYSVHTRVDLIYKWIIDHITSS